MGLDMLKFLLYDSGKIRNGLVELCDIAAVAEIQIAIVGDPVDGGVEKVQIVQCVILDGHIIVQQELGQQNDPHIFSAHAQHHVEGDMVVDYAVLSLQAARIVQKICMCAGNTAVLLQQKPVLSWKYSWYFCFDTAKRLRSRKRRR